MEYRKDAKQGENMKYELNKMYKISGVDIGMLLAAESTEEIKEIVERCIARPCEEPEKKV